MSLRLGSVALTRKVDGRTGDSYTHQNLFVGEELDRHLCYNPNIVPDGSLSKIEG